MPSTVIPCGTCGSCGTTIYDEPSDSREPCPQCQSLTRVVQLKISNLTIAGTLSSMQITVTTLPQTLLASARDLLEREQYGISVVVAHMACEVAVERAFSETFDKQSIQHLEKPIFEFVNGYNLGRRAIRVLYTAFTGDEIQEQPFWQKFKASSELRNKIVHKGRIASLSDAESSFAAANALVAHLKK